MITTTSIFCQSKIRHLLSKKLVKYLKLSKRSAKSITIFFLFLFLNASFLQSQQQLNIEVDLSYKDRPLNFILKDIAKEYPVNFSYGKGAVPIVSF